MIETLFARLWPRLAGLVIAAALGAPAFAQDDAPPAAATSLFDGTSLTGWSGDERFWSVEDGAIVGRSTLETPCEASTYLALAGQEYKNFDLTFEIRVDGEGGNSGLQFRSVPKDGFQVEGYQADLDVAGDWTGGLYEQAGRGVVARRGVRMLLSGTNSSYERIGDLEELTQLVTTGGWHTYRVRALGTRIQIMVDGVETCDVDDRESRFNGGTLAFQLHEGPPMEVRVRSIEIQTLELPDRPASNFGSAAWIWSPEGAKVAQLARFERSIQAKGPVTRATLFGACDNGVEFSIDDTVFAGNAEWQTPFALELPPKIRNLLSSGKKCVLRAECWNSDGPAGLIMRLQLEYEDGSLEYVESNRWWTTRVNGETVNAEELGPFGIEPWGTPKVTGNGLPDLPLASTRLELAPGFEVDEILRVPRAMGSWVALTVDDKGRIIAAAEAKHGLFRVTLQDGDAPKVESLGLPTTGAQGLLAHGSDLFIVQNDTRRQDNGLYRARDTTGDDQYDDFQLLTLLDGSGEHGPHAVRLAPDGEHLEVIAGNSTAFPKDVSRYHVAPRWEDDQLVPSLPDTFGHGNAMHNHGGWLGRCTLDGTEWEILNSGMRNAYSFAYDAQGERFAYDSDMEWDMGAPWYRAPRVLHLAPGAEFGWRRGSGKVMDGEPDTLGAVASTGPASPVGVLHGADSLYPGGWANALFIGDWTRGRVYSVELEPDGDTFSGEVKPFVSGRPFPVTDMTWLSDGSMALATGGRGRRSALYRIAAVDPRGSAVATSTDEAGEALGGEGETAEGRLAAQVRRAQLELDPDVATWAPAVLQGADPVGRLALARVGDIRWQAALFESLMAEEGPLDHATLRAIEVSLARTGMPADALTASLRARIEADLPAENGSTPFPHDVKRTELLVALGSARAPAFAVPLMLGAETQERAIDFALQLRRAHEGWTPELAQSYLDFLHVEARGFRGGRSMEGYLDRIRNEALERAGKALPDGYAAPEVPASAQPAFAVETPIFREQWSLRNLGAIVQQVEAANDPQLGEHSFRLAGCYACHRVGEVGGGTGPDLTDAGGRFTARDLMIAILEPSRDISDQYVDTEVWTEDSTVFVGRLVEKDGEWTSLRLPPSEAGGTDGELVDIAAEDIKLVRPHPLSRMPSGTVDCLRVNEIAAMAAWLLSDKREGDGD
jgi:putative heme-binding domain-containing protein